jgi:hypothetical protein
MAPKKLHTIYSLLFFIAQGLLVYMICKMFINLRDSLQVSSSDIFTFNVFLVSLSIVAVALCIWSLFLRGHSLVKLLCLLLGVGMVLLAFNLHYKSMAWPYNFRLTLVNKTNRSLDKLRLSGCQDLEVDTLKVNSSRMFVIPLTEGCTVYLVNNRDSVAVAAAAAQNTGYRKEYVIQ